MHHSLLTHPPVWACLDHSQSEALSNKVAKNLYTRLRRHRCPCLLSVIWGLERNRVSLCSNVLNSFPVDLGMNLDWEITITISSGNLLAWRFPCCLAISLRCSHSLQTYSSVPRCSLESSFSPLPQVHAPPRLSYPRAGRIYWVPAQPSLARPSLPPPPPLPPRAVYIKSQCKD